jgi:16S rRNA (uracil1498-N3)-methyltransferase
MYAPRPKTQIPKAQSPKTSRSKARLFVEEPLAADAALTLTGNQTNYLINVMRVQSGDTLLLFNGRDGEWQARVEQTRRQACMVRIVRQVRPQRTEPGPWLLFAPIKKTALDFLVEKATELGVCRLWPLLTLHTAASRVNLDRLRAHAIEASEQCERLTVPAVESPLAFSEIAARWPPDRALLVLDEHGRGAPIAEVLAAGSRAGRRCEHPSGILVGPEGGLAAAELDALSRLPFVARITLGPRILKSETAALAALACWQAIAGDGRDPPPPRDGR